MKASSSLPDSVHVNRFTDTAAFRQHAEPYLVRNEARHNLPLGILSTITEHPTAFSESPPYMVAIESTFGVEGVALMTPPRNLVLSQFERVDALLALVDALLSDQIQVPGAVASVPVAEQFVQLWSERSGMTLQRIKRQGIYRISRLNALPTAEGAARFAGAPDRAQLITWTVAFAQEVGQPVDPHRVSYEVDRRLADPDSGYYLWEVAGSPVAFAGYGGRTPNGIRIGPVYTPLLQRRHGYGTALTGEVSRRLMAAGRKFCFLYTDLANPTANGIYHKIGYQWVCESEEWRVES